MVSYQYNELTPDDGDHEDAILAPNKISHNNDCIE